MPTNVGTANYAAYFGIPGTTLTWVGATGLATLSGTLLTAYEVSAAGETSMTRDNSNEVQAIRTTNIGKQYTIGVKPVGAAASNALATADDLPIKNSILTMAGGSNNPSGGTITIDEARASFTPDGECVLNFTVTKHIGKTFAALS